MPHNHPSINCRHANFGDIGMACKELVDEFQKHTTNTKRMNTIEDMQNFVENFSEFSAAQRNAGKHVTLVSELSRVVDARSLMQVGLGSFRLVMGQATVLSAYRQHHLQMQQSFQAFCSLLPTGDVKPICCESLGIAKFARCHACA